MNNCQNGYMQPRSQGRWNNPPYNMNMPARNERSCGCNSNSACIDDPLSGLPVAMAYVPWQTWKDLYEIDKALEVGTIFEELDKPFLGRRCSR